MSSAIRTFYDEYKGEPETHVPGKMSIVQHGVGNGETGVSFTIRGQTIFKQMATVGLTLNRHQLKVLVADLIEQLSGDIHGDIDYDESPLTEAQARKINSVRLFDTERRQCVQ